jgi:hypothetical protein
MYIKRKIHYIFNWEIYIRSISVLSFSYCLNHLFFFRNKRILYLRLVLHTTNILFVLNVFGFFTGLFLLLRNFQLNCHLLVCFFLLILLVLQKIFSKNLWFRLFLKIIYLRSLLANMRIFLWIQFWGFLIIFTTIRCMFLP